MREIANVIVPYTWDAVGLKHPDYAEHQARLKTMAVATHPLTPQGTTAHRRGLGLGNWVGTFRRAMGDTSR